MAVVDFSASVIQKSGERFCSVVSWAVAGATDTYQELEHSGSSDRSVQMAGTFAGATVALQGSNDGTNYSTLTDPQGNALSFTAAGIKQVAEITRYVKPVVTAGTPTAVTVAMLTRNPNGSMQ